MIGALIKNYGWKLKKIVKLLAMVFLSELYINGVKGCNYLFTL